MRNWFGFCLSLVATICASPVLGAEIATERRDGVDWIHLRGKIEAGDAMHFQRLAIKTESATVVLESHGGALEPALKIGEIIRLKEFGTVVPDGVTCVSSCALIWVAGSSRSLGQNSRVGFHASYTLQDGRHQETGLGNALIGRYLTLLNMPQKAIVFATSASPSSFRWIDPNDSYESGISFTVLSDPDEFAKTPESGTSQIDESEGADSLLLPRFHWKKGQWQVATHRKRTACTLVAAFAQEQGVANKSLLLFGRDVGADRMLLAFANEKFRSIGEGEEYEIEMIFETDGTADRGWGVAKFLSFTLDDGSRGFGAYFNAAKLGKDLSEEQTINFVHANEVIDGFPLTGASEAYAQLNKCLRGGGALEDPFAR